MKSILTFLLFSIIFGQSFMFAQDKLPVDQKVYYGKDGRLYLNKDLGVYLWISTSPEEDSEKIRLLSDSSEKHTNPMYFDTEGYNTLRSPSAVDTVTKRLAWPLQDIIFEVYSDSRIPYTKIKTEGKLKEIREGLKVYQGDVLVTLTAIDAMSGIENTYYSIDGADFSVYNNTLTIKSQGVHEVKYYSTDNVGNKEEIKSVSFNIETDNSNSSQ